MADYYAALGVSRGAAPDEIKRAYRRLAMKYHPDRTSGDPDAEERFKKVSEAYAVLSDPEKKAEYDRFGRVKDIFGGMDPNDGRTISNIFGDIFGDLFGPKRSARTSDGRDLRYTLTLSFEEAALGCEKPVVLPRRVPCTHCAGSGARPGSSPVLCATCKGQGQVRLQQGFFPTVRECADCRGRGRRIADPCPPCRGEGRVGSEEKLTVRVPAGVDDGQRLRVTGKGEGGHGAGAAGDLVVVCSVEAHPIFRRKGRDLICEVPITFAEAALGGRVSVPSLQGNVKMKVPPATQTGRTFRLEGKGLAGAKGKKAGDLLVSVLVETPTQLTEEAIDALQKLQQLEKDAHPRREEFEAKVGARGRKRRRSRS